ncbi:hypothetical protein SALB1_3588 [Salinisphaera sp. LB1]|nr:hypothetical protein SALB1_3588 [Salinisphaera sp. LB1]
MIGVYAGPVACASLDTEPGARSARPAFMEQTTQTAGTGPSDRQRPAAPGRPRSRHNTGGLGTTPPATRVDINGDDNE